MMGSLATTRDLTVHGARRASVHPAGVVELADTPALGAGGFGRGGSNPSARMTAMPRPPGERVTPAGAAVGRPLGQLLLLCDGAGQVVGGHRHVLGSSA